jgi:mycofactocin biosynthesis protein MftB
VSTSESVAGPVAVAGPASPVGGFDPARAYRCSPSVALRPEPFGALVYHFGTRRLSFLNPWLVTVVPGLADQPDVHSALDAAGVDPAQRPDFWELLDYAISH